VLLFDETMSKGVGAGGGGGGGSCSFAGAAAVVAGPTVSAAAQAAQRQRSLLQRADTDIGSLLDNFSHLLKAARVLISTAPPTPPSSLFALFSLFLSGKLQACQCQPSGFLFFASESPVADIDSTRKQIYQRSAKPPVSKCSLATVMAARELIDAVC